VEDAPPTEAWLRRDTAGRIARLHALMRERGWDALVAAGHGCPDGMGHLRWIANARAWAGPMFGLLRADDPAPWILTASGYQARWARDGATTQPARVEEARDPIARLAQLAGAARRIGIAGLGRMRVADHAALAAALPGARLEDATAAVDALRRLKTAFEVAAIRAGGVVLDAAMDAFGAAARVGGRVHDAMAAAETVVRVQGAFWGRAKMALDGTPFTVPPPVARRFRADDVILFELVYENAWGYWHELTSVFAFAPLPERQARLLDAYLDAFQAGVQALRPGTTLREVAAAMDAALSRADFAPAGRHTPDGHSIGLDGADGPSNWAAPDFVLRDGMVISLHPGAVPAGGAGFLMSDNVLVTPAGGMTLSPRDRGRRLTLLEVS
jgi:Xaa-Pro aminopeptidase